MPLKRLNDKIYSKQTRLLYGQSNDGAWDYSHHVIPPITASATFRLESAERGAAGFEAIGQSSKNPQADPIYVYDRMGEPNNDLLQHSLAYAEGTECAVTFSSGMAAIHAAVSFSLSQGNEIISHRTVYGCTYSLFTNWLIKGGIKTHFVDLKDPNAILPHVSPATRIVYLESPVNPSIELIDIAAVTKLVAELNAKRPPEQRILTIIDNTLSTPFCQRPLEFGVDIIVHSLTKGISGFGIEMGGAVLTRQEYFDQLILQRKDFGAILSPHSAWNILVHGLPTLHLRIPKQQESAQKVAEYLSKHSEVEFVRYPGLPSFAQYELAQRQMVDFNGNFAPGFMLYFGVKGRTPEESKQRAQKLINFTADNSYAITLAVSLGQLRTLIEHPGSMTHASYTAEEQIKRGIDPGGVRLSIGAEHADDIILDLEAALAAI